MLRRNQKVGYIIAAICLVFGAYLSSKGPVVEEIPAEGLQLTFVDVGQGDSVFLKTENGETWLVDGGEDDKFSSELMPFLEEQGVEIVDYAVVTHYHNDHIGGIFKLLKSGRIKTLVLPDYTPDSNAKYGLLNSAESAGTKIIDISAGDTLTSEDTDLKISVLHPEEGGFDIDNENSNSTVLKIDYFDTSALLVGDLETDAEEIILPKYELEVDILKVGHHGSGTSTGAEFLAEVNPTYGIISAGEDNRYGHPHYEVVERLRDDDVMIYRTDRDGDVTFILDEQGIVKISTETNYAKE